MQSNQEALKNAGKKRIIKRDEKGHFVGSGNPSGKPKGTVNKDTLLKSLLEEVLQKNYSKVRTMLNSMVLNKRDLKWFMQLKASLEPKAIEHSIDDDTKGLLTNALSRLMQDNE